MTEIDLIIAEIQADAQKNPENKRAAPGSAATSLGTKESAARLQGGQTQVIKIEPPAGGERNVIKVTVINQGMQLSCEIPWSEWCDLQDDARYLRRHGNIRVVS